MLRSEIEERNLADGWPPSSSREHRFKGGPPPRRIYKMQIAHEGRARKAGVKWDMVDLRTVYAAYAGVCGICGEAVPLEFFTIDHIVPISKGGPHVASNLQIAHTACNSAKGDR